MDFFMDRIDAVPIVSEDIDAQLMQWMWVLVDTLNENFSDIQQAINFLTAPSYALLNETVTLTSGVNTFTVANGSLYKVGYQVIGSGIPANTNITSIAGNVITISNNASSSGASALTFVPAQGDVENGILLYDTTNNVYVGMQAGVLVKFTTTSYP